MMPAESHHHSLLCPLLSHFLPFSFHPYFTMASALTSWLSCPWPALILLLAAPLTLALYSYSRQWSYLFLLCSSVHFPLRLSPPPVLIFATRVLSLDHESLHFSLFFFLNLGFSLTKSQENMVGQLMAIGRIMWGPKVPTLKATEASLSYAQCFLYLVSSSINVSIFHITWLDTF